MGLELGAACAVALAFAGWIAMRVDPRPVSSRHAGVWVAVVGVALVEHPSVWSSLWAVCCAAASLELAERNPRDVRARGWAAVGAVVMIAGQWVAFGTSSSVPSALVAGSFGLAVLLLTPRRRSLPWTHSEWLLAAGVVVVAVRAGVDGLPSGISWSSLAPSGTPPAAIIGPLFIVFMVLGAGRPGSARVPMLAAIWAGGASAPWEVLAFGFAGVVLGSMMPAPSGATVARATARLVQGAVVLVVVAAVAVGVGLSAHEGWVFAGVGACIVWGSLTLWVGDPTAGAHKRGVGTIDALDRLVCRAESIGLGVGRGIMSALDLGLWTPLSTDVVEAGWRGMRRIGRLVGRGSPRHPRLGRVFAALGFCLVLGWLMLKPTTSTLLPNDVFSFGGLQPDLRGSGARSRRVSAPKEAAAR